jgi:FixJ family two-component response regulator
MRPGLAVIYTSGGGQTDGMVALFVDGSTFLGKPYKKEDLLQAVKRLEGACEAPLNDPD